MGQVGQLLFGMASIVLILTGRMVEGFSLLCAAVVWWLISLAGTKLIPPPSTTRSKVREAEDGDGSELGSGTHGRFAVPDSWLNKMLLIVGTTGSGKTTTLRHFYRRAIREGYAVIAIDGKPDQSNIEWIRREAEESGKNFNGFNCADFCKYDFLSSGGETELKDKIIALKDWESDYYRSLSEVYLQTVFRLLRQRGGGFALSDVIRLLDYAELVKEARILKDEGLMSEVKRRGETKIDELKGLQAHLETLASSELGRNLCAEAGAVRLSSVLESGGVMFFALPALRYPSFSSLLGKLVINDIKATIERNADCRPVFCIFDEFSIFAGEPVLNLINMGRGKGVHGILGTQGLDDLARAGREFKGQVLNCINTLIVHRVNSPGDAEELSAWIGTRESIETTHQVDYRTGRADKGSQRKTREYLVHPDEIKNGLAVGEAFVASKCTSPPTLERVEVEVLE